MKPETPAAGIMLRYDSGDMKTYLIDCECTDPDHAHTLSVEADKDFGITVSIWTTAETPVWSVSRWRLMWQLLTTGTVKYNVGIILKEQQALNYADALIKAIADVKDEGYD